MFKINGQQIYVLNNSFNYIKRIDDVFGTGSLLFESKTITENIPPYSILENDNEKYCCSSVATYHYGSGSWIHNVSIIEATSLLSRFIIGSKAFSITGTNRKDWQKINILLELILQKYNFNIRFDASIDTTTFFTKEIEYVFTAGTTLFDALNDISKNYNCKIYVSDVSDTLITLSVLELDNENLITIDGDIVSKTKLQNAENYCKYLETEANNVIDTNQLTKVQRLTGKADGIRLTQDNFRVELPTPIFKVEKMEAIKMDGNVMDVTLKFDNTLVSDYVLNNISYSYSYLAQYYPILDTLYDEIFSKYFYNKTKFYNVEWTVFNQFLYPKKLDEMHDRKLLNPAMKFDISNRILSKERYDLIEDKYKPNYAYYTYGSNLIDGFNIYYKDEFWNEIIGETRTPFIYTLANYTSDTTYYDYEFNGGKFEDFKVYTERETSAIGLVFNVEYYPIANPFMINTKTDIPLNETTYKPYAISYNKSSNYVDFDKMTKSMQIENESIGKTEMIVEYRTDKPIDYINQIGKLNFEEKIWYVSSCEIKTISHNVYNVRYNLVSNYNKIADVISLNSQYNTTKNPLQNIIERPIFVEFNDEVEYVQGNTYIKLQLKKKYANPNTIEEVYLPAILFNNGNDTYIYYEALDQYSIGKQTKPITLEGRMVYDYPYVDENNELEAVNISIVSLNQIEMDYDTADKLPQYYGNYTNLSKNANNRYVKLYKDAREKLTFTIKLNNCIIK